MPQLPMLPHKSGGVDVDTFLWRAHLMEVEQQDNEAMPSVSQPHKRLSLPTPGQGNSARTLQPLRLSTPPHSTFTSAVPADRRKTFEDDTESLQRDFQATLVFGDDIHEPAGVRPSTSVQPVKTIRTIIHVQIIHK